MARLQWRQARLYLGDLPVAFVWNTRAGAQWIIELPGFTPSERCANAPTLDWAVMEVEDRVREWLRRAGIETGIAQVTSEAPVVEDRRDDHQAHAAEQAVS